MKLAFILLSMMGMSTLAHAISDADLQKCVTIKNVTLRIIADANKGATRSEQKARWNLPSINPTIDFVYDFRGAKSDNEIASHQMDSCIRQLSASPAAPSSKSLAEAPKHKATTRRMDAAECRLLARAYPSSAVRMGNGEIGISELRPEIASETRLPDDAVDALIGYLASYRSDSLRAFPYEMAGDFEKKCLAGKIRAKTE